MELYCSLILGFGVAVSYTHLDVYKRQAQDIVDDAAGILDGDTLASAVPASVDQVSPVSYTHLPITIPQPAVLSSGCVWIPPAPI